MNILRRFAWAGVPCLALATTLTAAAHQKDDKDAKDAKDADTRPKITLRAQPTISIAPSRVVLTAELVGGADDYQDFYCPTVEWEWGDGTRSSSTSDCEPYEQGKSTIKRHFIVSHMFVAGSYHVVFRLKHNEKSLAMANANVQVRPGLGDPGR